MRIGGYDTGPKQADLPKPEPNPVAPVNASGKWIDVVSAKDLSFKAAADVNVKPMYRITDEKYAVYWATEKKA